MFEKDVLILSKKESLKDGKEVDNVKEVVESVIIERKDGEELELVAVT